MQIYLDELTDFFPWLKIGTEQNPIIPLEKNATVLKEFSNSSGILKMKYKIQDAENNFNHNYTEEEIKEYLFNQIRYMFHTDEDDEKFILLRETDDYLNLIDK